jgi:hypothetical protein
MTDNMVSSKRMSEKFFGSVASQEFESHPSKITENFSEPESQQTFQTLSKKSPPLKTTVMISISAVGELVFIN